MSDMSERHVRRQATPPAEIPASTLHAQLALEALAAARAWAKDAHSRDAEILANTIAACAQAIVCALLAASEPGPPEAGSLFTSTIEAQS